MKLRLVAIILLLSLLLFFGFKKVSANKNNYKISNSKINKINYLGAKIFEDNVKEIKNYL